MGLKQPVSVLVVIHTVAGEVLLIERADRPGLWQSVTGSREGGETLLETARREVAEETGLCGDELKFADWGYSTRYEIYPQWRHRYPEGVTHNVEHAFGLCLPAPVPVVLSPDEHIAWRWVDWRQAARAVFSPSNAEAILRLQGKLGLTER
ncbi:dihydroneopterin triphosphate diphosphatase [Paludibacterium paludis]|uniref:NUDIX pyrophosphatase n=1 Tax=Paludibacterium paludis TaxID=1225769 RepID=A0A918P6Z1_9NEIS|nr:dihydroneopterin triphosphate diphosphatase [Paludibacterium paludis]GGY28487.1 NUDIX pyrophosphatase [Paludibacterium paludis]